MEKAVEKAVADLVVEINAAITAHPDAKAAEMRAVRRGFSKKISEWEGLPVLKVARDLVKEDNVWSRFFAYELVQNHAAAAAMVDEDKLWELGRGMKDWPEVDTFACYVAGPAWRAGQVENSVIMQWARSRDRWWRRAALVATVPLNTKTVGGSGDVGRTLTICELLIDDRDEMVVKAMSWALRALSKRSPQAVNGFMTKYQERLAPRVLQEVSHKILHGTKA